jgi:hypothetical protein
VAVLVAAGSAVEDLVVLVEDDLAVAVRGGAGNKSCLLLII